MKSLAEGGKGFMYMSQVLVVMLQTLLQDGVAEVSNPLKWSIVYPQGAWVFCTVNSGVEGCCYD